MWIFFFQKIITGNKWQSETHSSFKDWDIEPRHRFLALANCEAILMHPPIQNIQASDKNFRMDILRKFLEMPEVKPVNLKHS